MFYVLVNYFYYKIHAIYQQILLLTDVNAYFEEG